MAIESIPANEEHSIARERNSLFLPMKFMALDELWHWLVNQYFNIAGAKLLWDFLNRLYKRFYSERVILELYIAWESTDPTKPVKKKAFLTFKNQTNKRITFTNFSITDSLRGRFFPHRFTQRHFVEKPIVSLEPKKRSTIVVDYTPKCFLFYSSEKYFGVETDSGRVYWINQKQLKAAIKEFRADFPDAKAFEWTPIQYQKYSEISPPSPQTKT